MSLVHNMVGGASGGGIDWDSAILHIYAPAGSAVTVSKGGTSHSLTEHPVSGADSEYLYYVKAAGYGTWTVTASKSGQTDTETVIVADNVEYPIYMSYFSATLRVYANDNSTVTATDGTHTVNGTVSGTYVDLTIQFSGTWTVTTTKGEASGTTIISIIAEQLYELTLPAKLYLYDLGNESTSVTNGWSANDYRCSADNGSSWGRLTPTLQKGSNSMTVTMNKSASAKGSVMTGKAVNVSDYTTMKCSLNAQVNKDSGRYSSIQLILGDSKKDLYASLARGIIVNSQGSGQTFDGIYSLDISAISGNAFPTIHCTVDQPTVFTATIRSMWLE